MTTFWADNDMEIESFAKTVPISVSLFVKDVRFLTDVGRAVRVLDNRELAEAMTGNDQADQREIK